ncbi:MAG: hypothetical protein IT435_14430 [Phycisphaerales bacterium]|nr:hypothetical protein [Phycisphaerales bacterium]
MIAVIVILVGGGAVFTLWWWKLADKWANAENRRFKKQGLRPSEEPKRIVVKGYDKRGPEPGGGQAPSPPKA